MSYGVLHDGGNVRAFGIQTLYLNEVGLLDAPEELSQLLYIAVAEAVVYYGAAGGSDIEQLACLAERNDGVVGAVFERYVDYVNGLDVYLEDGREGQIPVRSGEDYNVRVRELPCVIEGVVPELARLKEYAPVYERESVERLDALLLQEYFRNVSAELFGKLPGELDGP